MQAEKFDLDLAFGEEGERQFQKIFNGATRVEVKTERDAWRRTGNIIVEIGAKRPDGSWRESGLKVTESDWWAQNLSYNGETIACMMFKTEHLRHMVSALLATGKARLVMGGDDNRSLLAVVPIDGLFEDACWTGALSDRLNATYE